MQTKRIGLILPMLFAASAYIKEGEDAAAQAAAAAQEAAIAQKVQERLDAEVAKRVAAEVAGLKAKNEELLGANRSLKDKAKEFDGLNAEELKAMKARLDGDEDSKLVAEGKTNVLIDKYTSRMREAHKAELEAEQAKTAAEAKRADTYRGAVLDNQLREAASGLHPGAIEDALLAGRQIFSLDPQGKAVKMDAEGRPELGRDGTTPFSPKEWMEKQKEVKPHWFSNTTTGSDDGRARENGSGNGKTMKRADFDKLGQAQQIEAARTSKIID